MRLQSKLPPMVTCLLSHYLSLLIGFPSTYLIYEYFTPFTYRGCLPVVKGLCVVAEYELSRDQMCEYVTEETRGNCEDTSDDNQRNDGPSASATTTSCVLVSP